MYMGKRCIERVWDIVLMAKYEMAGMFWTKVHEAERRRRETSFGTLSGQGKQAL